MSQIEHLLGVQDEVGETPLWIPEERALYWIDMEGLRVHRLEPATGEHEVYEVDFPITALARRASGGWIAAAKTGVFLWDHRSGESSFLVDPEADHPDLRFNDGAIDRQGRFLLGTLNQKDLTAPDGALYRLDADGSIHKLDSGFATANGIGLSPDGRTLYFTDMFANRILAFDYDTAAGTVSGRRTFATVPADAGLPDGLIVDAEGFVWSAHWGGWKITRYDPDGAVEREVPMPVANPTCLAFGGGDLDELYVTSAWFMLSDEDRTAQPTAGDLFRIKTDVTGLAEPAFAG
ncbi:MAG TPA: SMP-30/gluconolactonase/LRE family protein [Phycisphaerae bacterium]|nr:SMP-30/gluconolactonase/LRE family protein [Phycisphaerae bacterium]